MPTTSSSVFSDRIEDYEFKHEVGVGSFGRVYEAFCKSNNRKCAIKRIEKKGHRSPNPRKIETEVSIHMRLKHPSILELYRVIEDRDHVYLILELCGGGSLKDLIKTLVSQSTQGSSPSKKGLSTPQHQLRRNRSDGNLLVDVTNTHRDKTSPHHNKNFGLYGNRPENHSGISSPDIPVLNYQMIRKIVKQICHGLQYLHRNNILHRDLNINNILLKSRYSGSSKCCSSKDAVTIKICDFGLALDMRHREDTRGIPNGIGTTICGTPGFISPEVWRQTLPVSPASDLFSIGSILYSLISGVTSPNGDLHLDHFPPLAADLISRLLDEVPENRLSLEALLNHPFIVGNISTDRLCPISKTTKSLQLSITDDGSVRVLFLKNQTSLTIHTKETSENITVSSKRKAPEKYSLETLPEIHWKKYLYAHRFVDLVKAKTPKVIIYCQNDCHKVSSIDSKGNRNTIIKCSLMENSGFEAMIRDQIREKEFKADLEDEDLKENNAILYAQMKDLYNNCLQIEEQMEILSKTCKTETFPVTIGKKSSRISKSGPRNSVSPSATNSSLASSHIFRSVQIRDVGTASQLPDGIEVKFLDGSSLTYTSTDSQIIYSDSPIGPKKRYSDPVRIPPFVRNKLSLVPTAIQALRQRNSFSCMSC